jgi:hypothetical protein
MALRMIRYVDKQSSHSRWQPFFPYGSSLFQIRICQLPNPPCPIHQRRTQFRKRLLARYARIEFRPQKSHLLLAQASSFGVRQQPIQTARQMPNVKGNRRRSRGPRIYLGIGEISAPLPQVFLGQLQSVQNRAPHCWDIRLRSA